MRVFAARSDPSDVAKMDTRQRAAIIQSRFHKDQFYQLSVALPGSFQERTRGSFGSSLGCGLRMMSPSHLRPAVVSVAL